MKMFKPLDKFIWKWFGDFFFWRHYEKKDIIPIILPKTCAYGGMAILSSLIINIIVVLMLGSATVLVILVYTLLLGFAGLWCGALLNQQQKRRSQ